jgi:hypothetical protein
MEDGSSWFARLMTWISIAVAAVVALHVAGWVAGMVLGVAGMAIGIVLFLLFKVVPILVIGWLIVKFFRIFRPDDEYGRA